jgi:hypothetical protein
VSIWVIGWWVLAGIFAVWEGLAFFRSRTGTLSDTIRIWAGVRGLRWTWRRWALLVSLVVLTLHLVWAWPV